jgi:hypothetical protein
LAALAVPRTDLGRPEPGVFPEGIIGFMEDLKARLADAEAKLSHVKEYL